MSDLTPQHPAAPETETDANGIVALLATHRYMPCSQHTPTVNAWWAQCEGCDWRGPRRSQRHSDEGDHRLHLAEVIATAARERVRVVEGERDAARALRTQRDLLASAMWDSRKALGFDTDGDDRYHTEDYGFISESFRRDMVEVRTEIVDLNAEVIAAEDRAEAAEAAHEAEKAAHEEAEQHIVQLTESRDRAEAAHERLRAGVEALRDEWKARGHITTSPGRPHRPVVEVAVDALTTLLGGGEDR